MRAIRQFGNAAQGNVPADLSLFFGIATKTGKSSEQRKTAYSAIAVSR